MREVHGWRRVARWLVGIAGGLLGLVVIAVVIALVVFQTGWGRRVLEDQVQARLESSFAGGGSIGSVSGNPLSELVLHDVVINGPDKQPAISVKRVTVKLPLLPLLSRRIRIDKLVAEELDVRVHRVAGGTLNVAGLMKPSKPSAWSVALPHLEVRRGHVRLDDVVADTPIDLDEIAVLADLVRPYGAPLAASVRITGTWRQRGAPVSLGAVLRSGTASLDVQNAALQIGDVRAVALAVKLPKSAFERPLSGSVAISAPADAVRALVPAVTLPADLALALHTRAEGRSTFFRAFATVGAGTLAAHGRADIHAKLASGIVVATDLDLHALTTGRLDGHGGGVAALTVDGSTTGELPAVAGLVTAWSTLRDTPPLTAVVAIDSRGDRASATLGAASDSGIRVAAGVTIRKHGTTVVLERGDLFAHTLDMRRAAAGKAAVRGTLSADLHANGTLAPAIDLAIAGHATGRGLRVQGVHADRLALRIDAAHVPSRPTGRGRIELDNVSRGDVRLGRLTIDAERRRDGKIAVAVRSEPKPSPWRIDLDALVATGETVVVELKRHVVRTGGSTWTGKTGRLAIGPRRIELRELRSTTRGSTLSAEGSYVRAGRGRGDLAARVDTSLALACLSSTLAGHVEAHVDVERRARRFTGTVSAHGRRIKLDQHSTLAFDTDIEIEARPDQLTANLGVSTPSSGSAQLALDVDTPADVTDERAWRELDRTAIRTARLTVKEVELADVAALAGEHGVRGRVDGSIELSPARASGAIKIRHAIVDAITDLGSLDAELGVAPAGRNAVKATLTAHLVPSAAAEAAKDLPRSTPARIYGDATFEAPERILDPAAWRQLGANAFRGGSLRAERLVFGPGTLERLGIVSPLRGEIGVGAELAPGLGAARFSIDVHELRGGAFAQAIAGRVVGEVDDRSTRVTADVRAARTALVHVTSELPITLDQLRADPLRVTTAPLRARARLDRVPLEALVDVLGKNPISGGTLDGVIDVAGTVVRPTVDAKLVARGVAVPSEASHSVQSIKELTIGATWDGATGNVEIDGEQSAGGSLVLRAAGSPWNLSAVTASIRATKLDIAPLVTFVPGAIGGLGGRANADLTLRGAEPRTAHIAGTLRVTNGRVPIAPAVGTLFNADIQAEAKDGKVSLRVTGKLGRGGVSLVGSAPLEGLAPRTAKLRMQLKKVRLLGVHEPILTGYVEADVERIGWVWHAAIRVDRATMEVPEDRGHDLAPVGAPDDMVFGGVRIHHGRSPIVTGEVVKDRGEGPRVYRRPTEPVVVARIDLRNVFVESEEARGLVNGKIVVSFGQRAEIGIVGDIALTRGVLELFSRRYDIDRAVLHYDGSLDPMLDIRISHDFPQVTTITELRGRLSNPRLIMTSDPAQYSQAELLGFLLGGEPGGDPEKTPSASERAVGAGASLVSSRITGYVRRALPLEIDVLRYESETATSSASLTIGKWVTDTLFLAYRRRLEARPDENTGEGEVEWWIRRRLFIEGVLGDRGVNGADLLWRRRW